MGSPISSTDEPHIFAITMTLAEEFRTRNWSIYGQWAGVVSMVLCFALGIANIFNFGRPLLIIFSAICLASSFVILFIEIPFLLRICPTSSKFDDFIRSRLWRYEPGAMALAHHRRIESDRGSCFPAHH